MAESYQGSQSLSHSKWDYKYHMLFIPKPRRKAMFARARRHLGPIFHLLLDRKSARFWKVV